ncbi:MAG: hypothetical protein RIB78_09960 [Gammaproteobacteria bacterium]
MLVGQSGNGLQFEQGRQIVVPAIVENARNQRHTGVLRDTRR